MKLGPIMGHAQQGNLFPKKQKEGFAITKLKHKVKLSAKKKLWCVKLMNK